MKTLQEYLIESTWSFKNYQRNAFASALGLMLGNLSDDDEDINKKYNEFKKTLTDKEIKELDSVFDFLENYEVYSRVNSKMLKDEMPLLKRFAQWIEDNDIAYIHGRTDWDLISAYEQILY